MIRRKLWNLPNDIGTLPSVAQDFTRNHSERRHVPTLDGWRALAILLVVCHHAGTAFYGETDYWRHSVTRFGTIGVPIFFGLSGFLITKLLIDEYQRSGRISLYNFYLRRVFRIFPALVVLLTITGLLGGLASKTELFASFLFWRNYLPNRLASIYSAHLWSLSVEEHFYLVWPAVFCCLIRYRFLGLGTVMLAAGFGMWRTLDLHQHWIHHWVPVLDTQFRTDYRIDGLLCGCFAAAILMKPKLQTWLISKIHESMFWLAACVFCFLVVTPMPIPMNGCWISILIPLLLISTALHPRWRVSRILSYGPLCWLGRISYSLYLWQQVFLLPSWENGSRWFFQQMPWNLAASLSFAVLSYYVIERPMIRVGGRLTHLFNSRRKPLETKTQYMIGSPSRIAHCTPRS